MPSDDLAERLKVCLTILVLQLPSAPWVSVLFLQSYYETTVLLYICLIFLDETRPLIVSCSTVDDSYDLTTCSSWVQPQIDRAAIRRSENQLTSGTGRP